MRYNKLKLIVGLFIIGVFLAASLFLFMFFKEKGVFETRYSYHFKTDSAEYFTVGMPIKFSGFNIGVIDNIHLEKDGSVLMTFSITKRNQKWMNEGSILMLIRPLLGSSHIELYTSLGTTRLKNEATLPMIRSDNINDLVTKAQPVITKAIDVLDNVHVITSYMANENSELRKIMQNLEKFTSKLANDDSLLTTATGDENATKEIIESIHKTNLIMQDLKEISSSLKKDIIDPASLSIKDINIILKDVKHKLDALDGTVNSIGTFDNELIEIKEQILVGVEKSNQIIDKVDSIMQNKSSKEVKLP